MSIAMRRLSPLITKRVSPSIISPLPIKKYYVIRCMSSSANDNSVTIGDITIDNPPVGSGASHLIPALPSRLDESKINASLPPCHIGHLRWMLQKDVILNQDFLLLGTPNLARER